MVTTNKQPGDPSASLLLTTEKAVFCNLQITSGSEAEEFSRSLPPCSHEVDRLQELLEPQTPAPVVVEDPGIQLQFLESVSGLSLEYLNTRLPVTLPLFRSAI